MPLPRKKLKLVDCSTTGRNRTRWIKPKIDDNQNSRESNAFETCNIVPHNDDYPNEVGLGLGLGIEVSDDETSEDALTASKERKTKTYEEIKKKDVENWAKLRIRLLKTAVERSHPSVECCLKCDTPLGDDLGPLANKKADQNTAFDSILFRCDHCGPFYYVCYACLLEDHQLRPNHIPERWNVSLLVVVYLLKPNCFQPFHFDFVAGRCISQYKFIS